MPKQVGFIMLDDKNRETDCRYAYEICRHFQRQNRGHNTHTGAASVVEITWLRSGALQTWVGFTLDNCQKVDKTKTNKPLCIHC
jgi:hypothetical protein